MVEQDSKANFNEVWGDKEPEAILEAMYHASEATRKGLPPSKLADKLGELFLIVPGDNEIGSEQTCALLEGFEQNPEGWEAILEK